MVQRAVRDIWIRSLPLVAQTDFAGQTFACPDALRIDVVGTIHDVWRPSCFWQERSELLNKTGAKRLYDSLNRVERYVS